MGLVSKVSAERLDYARVSIISKFAKWIARLAFGFSWLDSCMLSTTKLHYYKRDSSSLSANCGGALPVASLHTRLQTTLTRAPHWFQAADFSDSLAVVGAWDQSKFEFEQKPFKIQEGSN